MFAPVVLDLDGDGIELVKRKKAHAMFDYGGDGVGDDTGWISGDDGFLVIDRNNDGLITDAAELSLASENMAARSGLQGLAWLDSNNDGVVDANDARFGELRVWQDRNGNGVTDAGELRSLADAGISSISLNMRGLEGHSKLDNNAVVATTSFTRTDGTAGTAADVSLAYRPAAAPALVPAIDPAAAATAFSLALDRAATGQVLAALRDHTGYLGRDPLTIERLRNAMLSALGEGLGEDRQRTAMVGPYRPVIGREMQPLDQLASRTGAQGAVFSLKPEIANKLAMIRQDMAAFGAQGMDDENRMSVTPPGMYDWYM